MVVHKKKDSPSTLEVREWIMIEIAFAICFNICRISTSRIGRKYITGRRNKMSKVHELGKTKKQINNVSSEIS